MNLEWLLWDWEDDSRDETDADKGVAMPFAWELIDLDIDSSARPSEQIRVKRRKGRVMQWLSGGGKFEGDALGKVVGAFDDPEEAKKAVEEAVRATHEKRNPVAKKTSKEKLEDSIVGLAEAGGPDGEVTFEGPDGKVSSVTKAAEAIKARRASEKKERSAIEKLAEDLGERLARVVQAVEDNLAPKYETTADAEEYIKLDGELKRERRSLPTTLTREEVEAHGHELAETVQKIAVVEGLLDILRTGLRPTEKSLAARENALSGLVLRRERLDTVLCAHVLNYDASEVSVIRLDTGAVIEKRKPKPGEGQTRLGGT